MTSLPLAADRIVRRWPTERARQWLASFLEGAHHDRNIVAVVVVGSAIRSSVPSDDLDVVVLCHSREQLDQKAPIEVDLRSFELDLVESGLEGGQDLLTWSVRFGEALYDPHKVWSDLVQRWRERLPLPDASVARARAATALAQLEDMRAVGDPEAVVDLEVSYLTHLARAALAEAGVYPASRPELPDQLRAIGRADLANQLGSALAARLRHRAASTAV